MNTRTRVALALMAVALLTIGAAPVADATGGPPPPDGEVCTVDVEQVQIAKHTRTRTFSIPGGWGAWSTPTLWSPLTDARWVDADDVPGPVWRDHASGFGWEREWALLPTGETRTVEREVPCPKKVPICHRNQGSPEWVLVEIAESAVPAHLAHQWGEDIYPVPEGGCPVLPEPTTRQTVVPVLDCEAQTVTTTTTNYRTPFVWSEDARDYVPGVEEVVGEPLVETRAATPSELASQECDRPEPPDPIVEVGEWVDGEKACGDASIEQTRTVTTTVYEWSQETWSYVPGEPTTETETRTIDLDPAEVEPCPTGSAVAETFCEADEFVVEVTNTGPDAETFRVQSLPLDLDPGETGEVRFDLPPDGTIWTVYVDVDVPVTETHPLGRVHVATLSDRVDCPEEETPPTTTPTTTPSAPPAPPAAEGTLPRTGSSTGVVVGLGAALVALGGVGVLVRRRYAV